ncbi:MAG: hypothetical protein KJ593_03030 [Candidatus Omnitrophica bacterium]|nr:hypothetical protein [Candidatus Omnitrophota bacterium]
MGRSRKPICVGILRESRKGERRTPLVPHDVDWLNKRGIKVEVQSSSQRIFRDSSYSRSGGKLVDRFKKAKLILGIKEPDVKSLHASKIYMVFSHTIKGQPYNMPLLKKFIRRNITLIDYERIVDAEDRRFVYFGRFAGICGLVDSLYYLGERLNSKGIRRHPFSLLSPAHRYNSFDEIKQDIKKVARWIRTKGFTRHISPFVIGITGHGRVSQGIQEILQCLNPTEIHPRDMQKFIREKKGMRNKIYKIVLLREEKIRSKTGKGFYFEEYLRKPGEFESNLDKYLSSLNLFIHASYWDSRFPRMVTKEMIHALLRKGSFRLEFICDISCDINGSVELTYKTTSSARPVFVYNPKKDKFYEGLKSEGIAIMAVDNLPTELPRDASIEFSSLIRDYVYQIALHGVLDINNHVALPAELRRAVITQGRRLTAEYSYLKKFIKAD